MLVSPLLQMSERKCVRRSEAACTALGVFAVLFGMKNVSKWRLPSSVLRCGPVAVASRAPSREETVRRTVGPP